MVPSLRFFLFLSAPALLLLSRPMAQPTFRADKAYEDTVRILILSNDSAKGHCGPPADMVGIRTRDFVRQSLTGVPNVVFRESRSTRWVDVEAVWPGKLPHVLVHVNAGWSTESGDYINDILDRAADSAIGVVSIGDDAAAFAERTFGFRNVDNQPQPMGDARQFTAPQARLWIDLDGPADTVGGGGIIRNTTDSLKVRRLYFHPALPYSGADPAGSYRCQADADKYTVDSTYADKVTFMGYQRAFDGRDTVAGPRELQTIVSFQDDVRRGVALSYQPQFLADARAAHQINYDAVMYASFAHFLREPSLRFTDENGRDLAPGANWDPARGRLYLVYTDDFVRPDLAKTVVLRIANAPGSPGDSETVVVAKPATAASGRGLWRAEIPLAERAAVARSNGTAEVTLPSLIEASVAAHDENGLPDGGVAVARLGLTRPPPPPVVDTVRLAYMQDMDGNGAADQAVFVFPRPLAALPSSIGPVFWNHAAPALANARAPRLSFLPGSDQKVVVADFAGSEFPAGLTSVPPGGNPHAVFPAEGVFGGQKAILADSVGAVLTGAVILLGSGGAGPDRVPDTLVASVSEPLRAGFPSLLRFGRAGAEGCRDRETSAPVVPAGPPTVSPDGLRYTLILAPAASNPVSGDCAYLEGNGTLRDLPGHLPSARGRPILGPRPPRGIRSVSGYPAISASGPGGRLPGPDPLPWIPPAGYEPGKPFAETLLPVPGQPPAGVDAATAQPLPEDAALVRVVSTGRYIARVSLFDNLGVFIKGFSQSFGYKGELENPARRDPLGYQSFLVWNRRDQDGNRAGQGVYIWKIEFLQEDGARSQRTLRTGLLR